MIKRLLFLLIFLPLCALARGEEIAQVSVLGNGQLLLNGKPTDLQTLDSEFKSLKAKQGAIWYYRENPETDPPPAATEVIKLVIRYRLPIRLSKKPDFSDDADENERSQRKP